MQRFLMYYVFALCFFSLIFNLQASSFEDQKKAQMIQDLEIVKHNFEVSYAPADWKHEYAGWDIESAFEQSKNKILSIPHISTKQFQQIVREFVNTMRDYHVDVIFLSTEESSLPFSVKSAEGKYFIDWIDPVRLSPSNYDIHVGDELLLFDGHPIGDVVGALKKESSKSSNQATDQAFAEIRLTCRLGNAGDNVPQGPVIIKTRSTASGKISSSQLMWMYSPEHVKNPLDFLQSLNFMTSFFPFIDKKPKLEMPQIIMANPLHQIYAAKVANHEGGLGSRKSFIPPLGDLIWVKDDEGFTKSEKTDDELLNSEKVDDELLNSEKADDDDKGDDGEDEDDDEDDDDDDDMNWHAYIYQHPNGYAIGYVRIPHYYYMRSDAKFFGEILNHMEENTDALVIDQVNNPGGIVNFQYELASMLAIEPLFTPHHRIKITQHDAMEAHTTLEMIKLVEFIIQLIPSDHDLSSKEDDEDSSSLGIGFNYQQLLFLKAYNELILEEWNAGHTLTQPTPIIGVDMIHPDLEYTYSKPILMLINEMDFSGGELYASDPTR